MESHPMMEKIARAIAEPDKFDGLPDSMKEMFIHEARAAFAAVVEMMREPSEAMIKAASDLPCFQLIDSWIMEMVAVRGRQANWTDDYPLKQAWREMLDQFALEHGLSAALAGGKLANAEKPQKQ